MKLSSVQVNPDNQYNIGTFDCSAFSGKNTENFASNPPNDDDTWAYFYMVHGLRFIYMTTSLMYITAIASVKPV